ncbi:hypothetical protein Mapa_004923 [Marchantia paleacea]|nr:hypothetical protein Mapa_004923 [Marchantia paleacea]
MIQFLASRSSTNFSFLLLQLLLVTSSLNPGACSQVPRGADSAAAAEGPLKRTVGVDPKQPDGRVQTMHPVSPLLTCEEVERLNSLDGEPSVEAAGVMRRVAPFSVGHWNYAHATFYGDETAQDTMQGACGYGNMYQQGYGTATTALSSTLFNNGFACGRCFEIRCVASWACYLGNPSTIVTATNFCPANWLKPTNNGGWCNPPRQHFDMSKPAFEKIAAWRAGIVPVAYRRVPCSKQGSMEFRIEGNPWWHIVFITNVGGPGDLGEVYIRGSSTKRWVRMSHNWGVGYQVFGGYLGEGLSFMVISSSNFETVMAWNVVPANWQLGQTFTGGQFQHPR